jgi:hypothetical protein
MLARRDQVDWIARHSRRTPSFGVHLVLQILDFGDHLADR